MKQYFLTFFTAIVLSGVLLHPVSAQMIDEDTFFSEESLYSESIDSFNADIEVKADGVVTITETIVYNFGTNERRGIIRDIPLTNVIGTVGEIQIVDVTVTDETGTVQPFFATGLSSGEPSWFELLFPTSLIFIDDYYWFSLRIGDPEVFFTGKKTYVINYVLKNALGYFDDRTEIYWNVTGNAWEVPIKQASAQVTTSLVPQDKLVIASYCGFFDEEEDCGDSYVVEDTGQGTSEVVFSPTTEFYPGQGMTIAVAFPPNTVASSVVASSWKDYLQYWPLLLIPFMLYRSLRKRLPAWKRVRRLSEKYNVVAQYDPASFDPLVAAAVLKGSVDITPSVISAQLIYLATQGHIVIKKTDDNLILSDVYTFEGTDTSKDTLSTYSKVLFDMVSGKDSNTIKKIFYQNILTVSSEVNQEVIKSGYFLTKKDSGYARPFFKLHPFLALFALVNPGVFIWIPFGVVAGGTYTFLVICYVLLGYIFSSKNFKRLHYSDKGIEAVYYLEGLKLYIDVAEDERIKFHNAPEKTPELFEALLPFAMIFGLEKKWAKEFEEMYQHNPSWYQGGSVGNVAANSFVTDFRNFTSSTEKTFVSRSGNSSGSSGSRSGSSSGRSGGGGGGGGGRSW